MGTGKQVRRKNMAWGIFFSGKLTSADFSPSLLNMPFGLGWESHLHPLNNDPKKSRHLPPQIFESEGTELFCFS